MNRLYRCTSLVIIVLLLSGGPPGLSGAVREPGEVLSIIGENGENLSGRYVTGGMIVFVKTFMVTGSARR